MSRLVEYLVTGRLTDDSFIQHIVFPNNLEKLFLNNLQYMFKIKRNENSLNLFYEFQLTDEFGSPLYASCHLRQHPFSSNDADNKEPHEYAVICMLSPIPKSYTFRQLLHELHLNHSNNINIYPILAEFCRIIIPDTFSIQIQLPHTQFSLNPQNDCQSHFILQYLPPWLIATILHDVLTEKSVLFVSTSFTKLVHCSSSVQIMIKPLKYTGVLVPLVPYTMITTIEAPTYYIMGCHNSCLKSNSVNFRQSDLVIDLDTLDVINDISPEPRDTQDIEIYCKKVSKVVGSFQCHSDHTSALSHPEEQENEFRLLWKSWVINLCSNAFNDKKSKFNLNFSKTTMCHQFILDEHSRKEEIKIKCSLKIPLVPANNDQITQESFLELLNNASVVQKALEAINDPFYKNLCTHIWSFYDDYNPILDFDDCSDTLCFIIKSKMDPNLISSKLEEIMNHLSDADKCKLEQWDLPDQIKQKLRINDKRRSTFTFRKSLYLQKSNPSLISSATNISNITADVTKALQMSNSIQGSTMSLKQQINTQQLPLSHFMILNEMLLTSDIPLITITEKDLVQASYELLNQLLLVYSDITSLMYRAEKKEPIARFISDRKKILNLKKSVIGSTTAYPDFLNVLQKYSQYNLEGLESDLGKLCFWMNTRHTLFLHSLIVLSEIPEYKLKASNTVAYQLGGNIFSLIDMGEGLCRPNASVRFYTKSNNLWHGLRPELAKYAPFEYPQEANFILSDYTGSGCRVQAYNLDDMENQLISELNHLIENEFKIDVKKKRILMPLNWSWLYKEFGDHPNDMLVTICDMLPNNPFTTILKSNDAIRYENEKPVRISRKWSIKFFKEAPFCCKFKV